MSLTQQQYEKEKAEYAAWLASLTIGDEVAVRSNTLGEPYFILKVESLSEARGLLIANGIGSRFNRMDGKLIGERSRGIEPVTPEIIEQNGVARLAAWSRYECTMQIIQLDSDDQRRVFDLVQSLLLKKESSK